MSVTHDGALYVFRILGPLSRPGIILIGRFYRIGGRGCGGFYRTDSTKGITMSGTLTSTESSYSLHSLRDFLP